MKKPDSPDESPPPEPSLADLLAIGIATAGGAGYFPVAPGTAGALVGVAVYVLLIVSGLDRAYVPVFGILTAIGVWAAGRVERIYGHDASRIVIDEVVGQMLTLGLVTRMDGRSVATGTILGFLLFRFFDILKPFPVRRLERLPGGFGVMADDLGAGIYAFLALLVLEPFATRMAGAL